ncbi:bifunctional metallophosphatase/5'-nucleotidase [Cohnella massiliensis]|uniref:bifunctional metallophosphatase/5'-nucleotidase n=1 Tax=Cohnella massiliensis TaxID=1816691 RepID=UPI001FE4480B|nr:bifunctional UDP-sugar hydrolase/5'-nucleotidase [Cohnella massiliensis]
MAADGLGLGGRTIERDAKVTLIHTNDLHSHLEEAARIASYIKEIRGRIEPDRLLLIDCGDYLDRVRPETEGTNGAVNRALLERLGYDAVTLGNNEGITWTREQLDGMFDSAPFPVVCANLKWAETGSEPSWMIPFMLAEKDGLKIGLLGLTAAFNDYYRLLGWEADDPIETAARLVPELRKRADVVVVISHLGLWMDERLAAAVDGIDLILGSHTHHLLETPLTIGRTTVCAAGKFGFHIGIVQIEKNAATGQIGIRGRCIPTADLPPDSDAEAIVRSFREQADAAMNGVVAHLARPLPSDPARENPLGTLLAAALRKSTGAEIGLTNAGQLLEGLSAGAVTKGDIHRICPSPINPCLIMLRGDALRRALEESLLPEFIDLRFQGFGFRGKQLGTLCFDGMEVYADETRPPYERVGEVLVGGIPLEDGREYAVGTLDMFTFGVGYKGLKEGRVVRYFLPEFIRDLLSDALNDADALADCNAPRWHLKTEQGAS